MRMRRIAAMAALVTLGAGCAGQDVTISIEEKPERPKHEAPALPAYAERRAFAGGTSGLPATILIVRIAPAEWSWDLLNDPAHPKSPTAWREGVGAAIAVNGAYFKEDKEPSGYLKAGGKTSGAWPRDMKNRAGYTGAALLRDGALTLAYLPEDAVDVSTYDEALLTYPTLVAHGDAVVEKESGLLARRTVLAEDAAGNDYLMLTEEGSVTLFELAAWLAAQPERFRTAVNLDGGPSTGISIKDGDHALDLGIAAVPNALVLRKND